MLKYKLSAALLSTVASIGIIGVTSARADDISDLRTQMQAMAQRLTQMETDAANAVKSAKAAEDVARAAQAAQAAASPGASTVLQRPKALQTDNSGNALGFLSNPVMLYDDNNTTLHMYGIIEATIGTATNQNKKGNTATGFQTAYMSGNRLGFDFDHALEIGDSIGLPGLKIMAKLENEFELPTGNEDTPGVTFGRDAWLGFESEDLGKLTFGRQNTLTRDFTQTWGDAYGTPDVTLKEGGFSNVNNYKQIIYYSGANAASFTRDNSAILWKKRLGQNWVVGLDYAFGSQGVGGSGNGCNFSDFYSNACFNTGGGGTPGKFSLGSSQSASVAYNNYLIGPGKLSVNANYNRSNNNTDIMQAALVGGTYVWDRYRIGAGYIYYNSEQGTNNDAGARTDNVGTVNGSVRVAPKVDVYAGYERTVGRHAGFLRGNFNSFIDLPFIESAQAITRSNTVDGSKDNVALSTMYHLDKQTDFYLASDWQHGMGGWSHSLFDNQMNTQGRNNKRYAEEYEFASGVRFKF